MKIYRRLSVMCTVEGIKEQAWCDVESRWKYMGFIFSE
jgi:hypothetical protein